MDIVNSIIYDMDIVRLTGMLSFYVVGGFYMENSFSANTNDY